MDTVRDTEHDKLDGLVRQTFLCFYCSSSAVAGGDELAARIARLIGCSAQVYGGQEPNPNNGDACGRSAGGAERHILAVVLVEAAAFDERWPRQDDLYVQMSSLLGGEELGERVSATLRAEGEGRLIERRFRHLDETQMNVATLLELTFAIATNLGQGKDGFTFGEVFTSVDSRAKACEGTVEYTRKCDKCDDCFRVRELACMRTLS